MTLQESMAADLLYATTTEPIWTAEDFKKYVLEGGCYKYYERGMDGTEFELCTLAKAGGHAE